MSWIDASEEEYYFDEASPDDDFYDLEEIGCLLEDDEISSEEEGFMLGYMED